MYFYKNKATYNMELFDMLYKIIPYDIISLSSNYKLKGVYWMKNKFALVILIFAIMLLFASCAQSSVATEKIEAENSSLQEENDSLKAEIDSLKTENDELKTEKNELKDQVEVLENRISEEEKEKVVQEGDVSVELSGKSTSSGAYDDYVKFIFSITNNTEKSIKGVQGVASFKDLFGVDILLLNADFTGITIKPGETVIVDDLSLDANPYIDDHMKLYNTAYDDLNFEYEVTAIVFTDGTSK